MVKSENIEFALQETISKHEEFKPYLTQMILRNIQKEVILRNFTTQNGARDRVEGLKDIDLVNYVVEELIRIVNAGTYYSLTDPEIEMEPEENKYNKLLEVFPHYETCKTLLDNCASSNKILYFFFNPIELIKAVDCVTKTKFDRDALSAYVNKNGDMDVILENTTTKKLKEELAHDYEVLNELQSIEINRAVYNKCYEDLVEGKQFVNKNNEYELYGDLYASQRVGKNNQQEDSVLIMKHPSNPDFSFLAVSDGVGETKDGEKASSYILKELALWFEKIPAKFYTQPWELQEIFNAKINQISEEIYNKYNSDGVEVSKATFTGAIVTSEKTLISSVGDSRAYTLNRSGINIVTRDDTDVWPRRLSAQRFGIDNIDGLRYQGSGNVTCYIGMKEIDEIQCYKIPNVSYDKLILLTDGISDLLSSDRIKLIGQSTSNEDITKMLVDEALEMSDGKKDNASAAMYARR